MNGEDFRHRAECRDADAELFFPVADSGHDYDAQVTAAKAVCAVCPVRAECLSWALDALPYGIAGGLTEDERRRERAVRPRDRRRRPILRPASGSPMEITAAGRAAIRSGASVREVADEFGVSQRTAIRWAAQARTPESGRARTTAGSAGCNRAPRQISTTHNAQAGTRTKEEGRS